MPQAVERPPLDAGLDVRPAPQVSERRPAQQLAVGAGEDHAVGTRREAPDVLGEGLQNHVR